MIVIGLYSVVWGKSKEGRNGAPTDEKAGGSHELPVASTTTAATTTTTTSISHNNNINKEEDGGMLRIPVSEASSFIA